MQNVSNDFKNQIVQPKTLDAKIIIGQNEITSDDINNIKRTWNSSLFKTITKMVDVDTNTPIEKDTIIEPQFGLHIDDSFEYVSLGKYKVHDEPTLNKDTNSYQTIAYDKIIESMINYELLDTEITYPCTVRELFVAIFNRLNWDTSGIPSSFVNSSSIIQEDVFSKTNMTYRDVLDELCTISCNFLIDIDDIPTLIDKNLLATISTKTGTSIHIDDAENEQIDSYTLNGNTTQDTTILPSEYQQVEYIQNSGTQYINTSYVPNFDNGFKVEVVYQPTDTTNRGCLFSNYNDTKHISYEIRGNGKERAYLDDGGLDKDCDGTYITGINTSSLEVTSTTTTQIVNGVTTTSSYSITGSSNYPAYLFVDRMLRFGTFNNYIKLYNCKIYESGVLIRNFVPCYRISDNEIGLYDTVNNTFHTNIGTGTFTKGNNVTLPTPYYPQEVKTVTGNQEIVIRSKNFLPTVENEWEQGGISSNTGDNISNTARLRTKNNTPISNGTYHAIVNSGFYWVNILYYDINGDYLYNQNNVTQFVDKTDNVFEITRNDVAYFRAVIKKNPEATITPNDLSLINPTLEDNTLPPQSYEINLGKNLFDKDNVTLVSSYINYNGTLVSANDWRATGTFIKIEPNKTYTVSCENMGQRFIYCEYENDNVSSVIGERHESSPTFTTSENANYIRFCTNSTNPTNIQLEKGLQATQYSAYKPPIELCKIEDYQDYIRKSTGINLIDFSDKSGSINNFYYKDYSTNYVLEEGVTYTLSLDAQASITPFQLSVGCGTNGYQKDILTKSNLNNGRVYITFTPTSTLLSYGTKLFFRCPRYGSKQTVSFTLKNIMLEKSSTPNEYEPYGTQWYIHKEIGKVVLDGSESWSKSSSNVNDIFVLNTTLSQLPNLSNRASSLSNYFTYNQGIDLINKFYLTDDNRMAIVFSTYGTTNLTQFQTWLQSHNTIVYYVLATPTNTIITDTELIGQLEAVNRMKTYKVINNISITASDLASPITINYVSDVETINEEYMCDNSVDIDKQVYFNSLVFSRVNDSDNIFRKDDEDIEQNGLHEFKVKDLQILSSTWRDNFIDEMWNYIKDFRYYAFDVNTNGITYLEPIDGFYLSTFGDVYPTLLLNDDLSIGNGLNEKIYSKEPIETSTEYKYADTTDKKINQAYIVVDKQNAQIQQLTQTTSNLTSTEQTHYQEMLSKMDDKASISDIETITNQVNVLQTDTYTKTEVNKIIDGTDENGLRVQVLQSTSAILNEDGMTYNKTGANTSSNINQAGVTVTNKKNNSELLFAGYDEQKLEALVRVANLYLTRFLGLDVWRIEIINDTTNGKGLGFFYIG